MKAPTRQFRFTIPTFLYFFPTCLCLSPNLRAIAVPVTCRAIGARTRLGAYAVTVRFIAVAFLASFLKTKLGILPMSLQLFLVAAVIAANIALDDLNLRLRPRLRPRCSASFGATIVVSGTHKDQSENIYPEASPACILRYVFSSVA
jgi:hypothetical protein